MVYEEAQDVGGNAAGHTAAWDCVAISDTVGAVVGRRLAMVAPVPIIR